MIDIKQTDFLNKIFLSSTTQIIDIIISKALLLFRWKLLFIPLKSH